MGCHPDVKVGNIGDRVEESSGTENVGVFSEKCRTISGGRAVSLETDREREVGTYEMIRALCLRALK